MLGSLYFYGDSVLHRLSPRVKVLSLILTGTLIFLVEELLIVGGFTAVVIGLYLLAQIPLKMMLQQLKPAIWILLVIFIVQLYSQNIEFASLVILRFASLILLAGLVTLTTRTSDMVEGIEQSLRYFHRWLPVERISLTITLCIRFIPAIRGIVDDVKEAQLARGFSTNIFAITVPVIIRTLQMADQISEAIYARSFEVEPYQPDHL